MTRLRPFAAFLALALLASCERNQVQEITAPLSGARVKFYNFSINGPAVNFYAGADKVTGVSSTTGIESTSGTGYGAVGLAGFYAAVVPGTSTITGRISATVDKNLAVSTLDAALADGTAYSYYMSGFYNTVAKTSDDFIVVDDFPAEIDFTTAYVRFVNAIPNAVGPMTLYRSQAGGAQTAIGAEIAYQAAGAFVAVPAGTYDLATRYNAGVVDVVTRTAVTFANGRVYTISARGDITVGGTTLTNRRFLDNTANR